MNQLAKKFNRVKELDGLRGIAVLLVLINHFNPSALSGGFIGVDVFFVLSGYVVSRSCLSRREKNLGTGLTGFYKRRFIRILPALIVCILITTYLSVLFIPKSWLSQSIESTGFWSILGVSNIAQTFNNDGYFAPISEYNPFTHTWSLGVEEQFYLLIPILIILLKPRFMKWVIGMLSVVSLILAVSWSSTNPNQAFYSIFSRFWELGIGVLLSIKAIEYCSSSKLEGFLVKISPIKIKYISMYIGLSLILIAAVFQDSSVLTPWPGSILPVVGTTLIIISTIYFSDDFQEMDKQEKNLLGNKSLIWIGSISYALYLWHWPVVVLMKWTIGLENNWYILVGISFSFVLACASTYMLERPLAKLSRDKNLSVIVTGLLAMILGTISVDSIFKNRANLTLSNVSKNAYDWYAESPLNNGNRPDKRTIFVLGNSHALAYSPLLERLYQNHHWNTRIYPLGSCTIVTIFHPSNKSRQCTQKVEAVLNTVYSESKPNDIVWFASLRMPRYVEPWGESDNDPYERVSSPPYIEALDAGSVEARDWIEKMNKKNLLVLIDRPKPVFKSPPFRCNDWFNQDNPICVGGKSISKKNFDKLSVGVNRKINEYQKSYTQFLVWDPSEVLCNNEKCDAMLNEKPLFFDGDHLSRFGNYMLYESFEAQIVKPLNYSD